jgi:histidinol phosphatase-like enzyme (inositol monophosphatase family)
MSKEMIRSRFQAARDFAVEAGKLTLNYFQSDRFQVERKSDKSPVTIADRESELCLRERIANNFPEDAIVGEEFGATEGTSGFRWILDPIDGTKSFISGVPLYGTMVGVEFHDECQIGAVYIPGLDEGVYACVGEGCHYQKSNNPSQLARVSQRTLADGLFVTSEVATFGKRQAAQVYLDLERQAYVSRSWGDCYGYLLVATGRAELMVDPILNIWDAAAVKPIIEEAGGHFVDWQGRATIHSGEAIGCNSVVLESVLEITRQANRANNEK